MALFLNSEAVADALRKHLDAQGETLVLSKIKDAQRRPMEGDPVYLAKGAKPARIQNPNADDAVAAKDEDDDLDKDIDLDEDEDEEDDEDADRRKARADAATKAIRKIHERGARAEDPDHIRKSAQSQVRFRADGLAFRAIKRARTRPMTMEKLFSQGNNNAPIDEADVQRIIAQGKREMRKAAGISGDDWNAMSWEQRQAAMGIVRKGTPTFKPSFPPNSANGQWGGEIAQTGADNHWDDENTQRPGVEHVAGHTDRDLGASDARIRAAVDAAGTSSRDATVAAIQMDWRRKKQQLAQSFADRPAARGGSNDMGEPQ